MRIGAIKAAATVVFLRSELTRSRGIKKLLPARTIITTQSEDTMQKSLHIDPGKCTGCLQCEMACSYEHTGAFNPSRSFIKVFTFHHEGRFAPYTCTQCDEAWCMRACPVDAISIDHSTGAKRPARSSSATSVAEIRIALPPVRPTRSPTSTRTGPVTTVCSPRRQKACRPPKSPRKHGGNESCHGQEKS